MNRPLFYLALLFWLVSLFVPTLPVHGGSSLNGYELVQKASIWILFFPFNLLYPIHIIGFASNLVVVHELYFAFSLSRPHHRFFSKRFLGAICVINLYLGLTSRGPGEGLSAPPLKGVLTLPGYYFWFAAFVALFVARYLYLRGNLPYPPTVESSS